MLLERNRFYRLTPRAGPGLACDADGVQLADVVLASVARDEGGRRCSVRPVDQLARILNLAYGTQPDAVARRCHRGLQRVARWLEAGDVAQAGIEAVMLRFPEIDAEGMAKLASSVDLAKGGSNWQDEPRIPAGQPGGGQWTTGGGVGLPPKPDRQSSQAEDQGGAILVTSPVRQSWTENANGFYPNSAGGGVLYIPSISDGQSIRPTEVHALNATNFEVGWTSSAVTLRDRAGHLYTVSSEDFAHFNATIGQTIGVSIYAFPSEPLGAPNAPSTVAEQRELNQERAALDAGRQASEHTLAGRITTFGVLLDTALLFPALVDGAGNAPTPSLWLNTDRAYEAAIALARRLGLEGEGAVGITGPKVAIRVPGSSQLRIPDALDTEAKTLTEVKNVARLGLTRQLRDFLAFCRAYDYEFEIWVRSNTKLTPQLEKELARDGWEIKTIPGS